ncbi:UDP-glycosyltransferase 83A1-like [Salvia divinorum]|uniref:UDP-glycosyltransferase 83A1-like n=1 Tax=Salvia divinorum TaxID=28513 RepID=A0ABD1FPR4_SALDI
MGAEPVSFSPPSVACLAFLLHTPKLLDQGNLNTNGSLQNGDVISLSNDMSFHGVSGPFLILDSNNVNSTNFFSEDSSCLRWLDSKPDGSVVYVSFGSLAVFSQQQLDELALGLELSGRAFLWVVRPDLANGSQVVYPPGFGTGLGEIVEWAPQNRVLSHPSIGCFVSHCGWNSTMEGVSNGLRFLCWPYFADQLHNVRYICDKWGIGLKIDFDEVGIRSRYEIKNEIDMLFSDNKFLRKTH